MAGRHRAKPSSPWAKPTALGLLATGLLASTVYVSSGLVNDEDTAAMAVTADVPGTPRPTTTPHSATTTPPPSTTTTPAATTTTTTSESDTSTSSPSPTTTEPETSTEVTEEPAPEPTAPPAPPPELCSTELDGTEPHVAQVGNHILTRFDVDSVGGRAARQNPSDHPVGLALDFMVDTTTGDALADYLLQHQAEFGVKYVIWRQRYNDGGGWSTMEDRGSPTANHMDHVHVSFRGSADVSVTC